MDLEKVPEIWRLKSDTKLEHPLVVIGEADPLAVEQYRVLYTKLEHISSGNSYKTFAITSAVKGEGKTVTSLNLAYVMAQEFKQKVILIECDLKNPSLTSYFLNGGPRKGLIDVIKGKMNLSDAIIQIEGISLYSLPAPHNIKNSSELLGSPYMNTVLNLLKNQFDYVIIDSPPILPLADVNILSKMVDGLVLVVRAGKTPKDIVCKAVNSVSNGNFIGIVLNGTERSLKKYYY